MQTLHSVDDLPLIHLVAVCLSCHTRHEIHTTPLQWLTEMENWRQKHLGHPIEFHTPRRVLPRRFPRWLRRMWDWFEQEPWWLAFRENADIKLAYASSAAYTITLASLASSATLVAGRESTAVSNTTNLYLDYMIGGIVTVGTTPTTNTVIEVWAYGSRNDVPTYPDVFDGTDSAETVTSVAIKQSALRGLAFMGVDATTSDRGYHFAAASLAAAFGGVIPANHGVFVTHSKGVVLNATGGNHVIDYKGVYITSV